MLNASLTSLLQVRGVKPSLVTVYQDGDMASVAQVARDRGVGLEQEIGRPRGGEGAEDIAKHYKWTFSRLFDAQPSPDYSIVVEDDMVFSPDFFDYFRQLAPLLDEDPSVWCISSWNDNANRALVKPDPTAVYRTEFFIGLGWAMKRTLFKQELEPMWPVTHWDHWMRQREINKGRECIFPEVPRNHNIGKIGTHSDEELFNKYFRDVALNEDPSPVLGDVARTLRLEAYDTALTATIEAAFPVSNLMELSSIPEGKSAVVVYQGPAMNQVQAMEAEFEPVSTFFGIWHSIPLRGDHKGVMRFWFHRKHVVLISHDSPFKAKVSNAVVLNRQAFTSARSAMLDPILAQRMSQIKVMAGPRGKSCSEVCSSASLLCDVKLLETVNNCAKLQKVFQCTACQHSMGPDQPCFVDLEAPKNKQPGTCLVNSDPNYFDCNGKWEFAQRLCACAPL